MKCKAPNTILIYICKNIFKMNNEWAFKIFSNEFKF